MNDRAVAAITLLVSSGALMLNIVCLGGIAVKCAKELWK